MPNKRDYLDMSETVKSKDITFNWLSMSKSSEKKYLYDVETRYEKLANDFDNGKIKIIKYELNHNVGANKNKNVYVLDWKTKQCSKFKKMSDFNL